MEIIKRGGTMVWRDQLVTEAATGAACDVHQGDTHQSTRCRLPKHQGILKTGFQSQGITCKNKHEDQIYTGTRYLPNCTRHRRIALHKSMLPKHQRVRNCEKMSQIHWCIIVGPHFTLNTKGLQFKLTSLRCPRSKTLEGVSLASKRALRHISM